MRLDMAGDLAGLLALNTEKLKDSGRSRSSSVSLRNATWAFLAGAGAVAVVVEGDVVVVVVGAVVWPRAGRQRAQRERRAAKRFIKILLVRVYEGILLETGAATKMVGFAITAAATHGRSF